MATTSTAPPPTDRRRTSSPPTHRLGRRPPRLEPGGRPAPRAVMMATGIEDVIAPCATPRAGLRVAVQSTGHGACGHGDLADTLLITWPACAVSPSTPNGASPREAAPSGRRARCLPPARPDRPDGSAHDVGVVGYSLGGGIGWFARAPRPRLQLHHRPRGRHARGDTVRLDAASQGDAFWATRGGGGGIGVITASSSGCSHRRGVRRLAHLAVGTLRRGAARMVHAGAPTRPDEVTSVGRILQLPPSPTSPRRCAAPN